LGPPLGGRIKHWNVRAVLRRQTTWTLFLTSPVVASTNCRGNLRAGAEMINATSLRSTRAFATPECVACCGAITPVGDAVDELGPSVTARRATRSSWREAWLPVRATKCATMRPFARRLNISTAGKSRVREKSATSRRPTLGGAASSGGGDSMSMVRRSGATSAIASSRACSTSRARSRRASSGSTSTSSGLMGSRSKAPFRRYQATARPAEPPRAETSRYGSRRPCRLPCAWARTIGSSKA